MSGDDISWPPALLTIVQRHLEAVEDADTPSIPPVMSSSSMTIYTFFTTYEEQLVERLARKQLDRETVEFCIGFAIEVMEHACQLSFLTGKERRTVSMIVRQMDRKATGPRPRGTVSGDKRRRGDVQSDNSSDGVRYCRVLPLEYLLRFFVAMPPIVDHYDRLGGSSMPAFSKRPLWVFASETLALLSTLQEFFTPVHAYTPLR